MSFGSKIIPLALMLVSPFVHSSSPDQFELLVRSGQNDSYALEAPSYLSNTELEINDQGQISFIYTGFDAQTSAFHHRVGSVDQQGKFQVSYQAPEGYFLSKPSLNQKGEILVHQHLEGLNDGLWKIEANGAVEQVISPKDYPEVQSFSSAHINSEGALFWRELDFSGVRSFVTFQNETHTTISSETQGIYSYLFSPVVKENLLASKVRLGPAGAWSESQPDQVVVWHIPENKETIIARDVDDDILSPYISFHNSVGLNSQGDVVFVASLKQTQKKAVVFSANGSDRVIAREGVDLKEIETFAPMINDQDTIVFRALDLRSKRSIFSWTPSQGLKKIISEGDLLNTDRETGRVLDSSWGPGFSGQIALNHQNILAFTVVLEGKNGESRLGTAIYRTKI